MKVTVVNAKAAIASEKVPLNVLPPAGRIHGALAAAIGRDKYGLYNFRKSKQVSYMMYLDAIGRHECCLVDGEDYATETVDGVERTAHHLGFIIASASILLDALEQGNLLDDRPAKGTAAKVLERERKK